MNIHKLKEIASIQTGVYLKTSPDANTVYLQVNDFDDEQNNVSLLFPTVETTQKNNKHVLNGGDILFASKGTNNFAVVFQNYGIKCVASSSFLVIRLKRRNRVIPEYVSWFLNLTSTLSKLNCDAVGTSIPSIPKSVLEELEVSIPSINKQLLVVKIDQMQRQEQKTRQLLAIKRKQLIENKLKNAIK